MNLKSLLLLLVVIQFLSCSENDDQIDSPIDSNLLEGTWTVTRAEQNGIDVNLNECELQDTRVFNPSNTFSWKFHFETNGSVCVINTIESGVWQRNLNMLTLTFDPDSTDPIIENWEIIELTESTLILRFDKPNSSFYSIVNHSK